jgi:hypothetical protein
MVNTFRCDNCKTEGIDIEKKQKLLKKFNHSGRNGTATITEGMELCEPCMTKAIGIDWKPNKNLYTETSWNRGLRA